MPTVYLKVGAGAATAVMVVWVYGHTRTGRGVVKVGGWLVGQFWLILGDKVWGAWTTQGLPMTRTGVSGH
jgi:hypothetical protein